MRACDRFKKFPHEIMDLPPGERALVLMYTLLTIDRQAKGGE